MGRADAHVRPVRAGDAEAVAYYMRAADVAEVRATGNEPLHCLQKSLAISSESFAVELGDEVAAIGGIYEAQGMSTLGPASCAVVWLLTAAPVSRHPIGFMRASHRVIAELLSRYPVLWNMVDARYYAALRWAARLGGEVHPAVAWGQNGEKFHPVVWRA